MASFPHYGSQGLRYESTFGLIQLPSCPHAIANVGWNYESGRLFQKVVLPLRKVTCLLTIVTLIIEICLFISDFFNERNAAGPFSILFKIIGYLWLVVYRLNEFVAKI